MAFKLLNKGKEVGKQDLATAQDFKLSLLAHMIQTSGAINTLVGQKDYAGKIMILKHQINTAMHVLNNSPHRALLADEVGLGKTIEAGIILKEYLVRNIAKKILILTPAPLAFQWQEELRSKFSEDFHIPEGPEDYANFDKLIVSIDTAKTERHANEVKKIFWDLVVIDEAHKLKNRETLNYKFVKSLQKERCFMLTATPLQNNVFELWNIIDLLHPGYLGTRQQFTDKFLADKDGLKIKNQEELQKKLGKIMIRNLRRDTGIKFAERKVKTYLLKYNKETFEFYQRVVQFIRKRYEQIQRLEEPQETEGMSKLELKRMAAQYKQRGLLTFALIMLTRQITSSIKTGIEALKRYKETLDYEPDKRMIESFILEGKQIQEDPKLDAVVKLVRKTNDKVIIFTTFLHTQKLLDLELKLNNVETTIFNGKMNAQEKEEAIKEFKEKTQVLITTDAGSEGRNLQFAHILVNYDLPWNPMVIEQRIGRVHRIGQEKDVEIYNFAIEDTVEAYILNRLYEKIDLFHTAVGEMDLIISELKSKKSLEEDIFEAYIKNKDMESITKDVSQAKEKVEQIKKFDREVFDSGSAKS